MSKTYTVKQVAQALDFSTNTVYKYLNEGKIKATRLGNEGRFRIAESELVRLLGLKPAPEYSENSVPTSDISISAPNLFDWFVAILAIFVGLSFFLLPSYILDSNLVAYAEYSKFTKLGLIIFGLLLMGVDILKLERKLWHAILHIILGLLFAALSYISYQTNYLPRALGTGAISLVLLSTTYFKISARLRFIVFVDLVTILAGWIFLNYPQSISFQPLSEWIVKNQLIFAIVWYSLTALVVLAGFLSSHHKIFSVIFALSIATGSFGYAFTNLSTGDWVDTVFNIVLGSFMLIFPFWRRFDSFASQFQKRSLVSFGWIMAIFIIGIALTFYLQESFKDYVKSDSKRTVETAAARVETFVNDSQQAVVTFSANRDLVRLMSSDQKDGDQLEEMIKNFFFSSNTLRRIALLDEDGRGLAIYPQDKNFIGLDLSFRDYFQQVRQFHKPVISEAVVPVVPGVRGAVVVAAPILAEDRFLGVITGSIDFVELKARLDLTLSPRAKVLMADGSGKIIIHEDPTQLMKEVAPEGVLQKAVAGMEGQVETYSEENVRSLNSFAPVKSLGWGIVIEQPLAEILKHQSTIVFNVFLMTIISGIGSLLVVLYLQRK